MNSRARSATLGLTFALALSAQALTQRPQPELDHVSLASVKPRQKNVKSFRATFDVIVTNRNTEPKLVPNPQSKHLYGIVLNGAELQRADGTWEKQPHRELHFYRNSPSNPCIAIPPGQTLRYTAVTGDFDMTPSAGLPGSVTLRLKLNVSCTTKELYNRTSNDEAAPDTHMWGDFSVPFSIDLPDSAQ